MAAAHAQLQPHMCGACLTTAKPTVKGARQEGSHMATLNDINKTL